MIRGGQQVEMGCRLYRLYGFLESGSKRGAGLENVNKKRIRRLDWKVNWPK